MNNSNEEKVLQDVERFLDLKYGKKRLGALRSKELRDIVLGCVMSGNFDLTDEEITNKIETLNSMDAEKRHNLKELDLEIVKEVLQSVKSMAYSLSKESFVKQVAKDIVDLEGSIDPDNIRMYIEDNELYKEDYGFELTDEVIEEIETKARDILKEKETPVSDINTENEDPTISIYVDEDNPVYDDVYNASHRNR